MRVIQEYSRKDLVELFRFVKNHPDKIKNLKQKERKTLKNIIDGLKDNVRSITLTKSEFNSLKNRLSKEEKPSRLTKILDAISNIYVKAIGAYISSDTLRREADKMYETKKIPFEVSNNVKIQSAADNYKIELLKLKDNIDALSDEKRLEKTQGLLNDIIKKLDRKEIMNLNQFAIEALQSVKLDVERFILDLRHKGTEMKKMFTNAEHRIRSSKVDAAEYKDDQFILKFVDNGDFIKDVHQMITSIVKSKGEDPLQKFRELQSEIVQLADKHIKANERVPDGFRMDFCLAICLAASKGDLEPLTVGKFTELFNTEWDWEDRSSSEYINFLQIQNAIKACEELAEK